MTDAREYSIYDPDVFEIDGDGYIYRFLSPEEAEERAEEEGFLAGRRDGLKGEPLPDEGEICPHYLRGWRKGTAQSQEGDRHANS